MEDQYEKFNTEAETVAVQDNDNVPAILCTRCFLEAQGYPLNQSVVHQDNQYQYPAANELEM